MEGCGMSNQPRYLRIPAELTRRQSQDSSERHVVASYTRKRKMNMKPADIQVGKFYHDGKFGLREVIRIDGSPREVRYKIHSAKQENEWVPSKKATVSVIGQEATVLMQSFCAWAKTAHDEADGKAVLTKIQARRIKLSTGEVAFMKSVLAECSTVPAAAGTLITFDHTEGRAVGGLQKKELVLRLDGQVEITELGAAVLLVMAETQATPLVQ